ncbi:MAG: hypothetical protein MZV63_43150 [Marinilabiliales bacterium]|nr:hypothetical protein [Marinilabiliales bacterium]
MQRHAFNLLCRGACLSRKGFATDTLFNVDVYNIVTGILRLTPAPNDGNRERISPLFR